MTQPIHILRKDIRHLWPEIAVSICLLIALAWIVPHTWPVDAPNALAEQPSMPWLFPVLGAFVRFLIPVVWVVVISRLVHDEPLVGDRQFWITRPYTWYNLLASKLLFIVLFLYGPLLVMQAWLQHHAGLHPVLQLWPLLRNLLIISAAITLPLLAIAAVTGTFVRYMLSVLAGVIYLVAVAVTVAMTMEDKADAPYMDYVQAGLMVAIPLVALLVQYARRRTALARTLLLALPVALVVLVAATPSSALFSHYYATSLPGTLTFNDGELYQQPTDGTLFRFNKKVHLRLPVSLQGVAANASIHVSHAKVALDAPGMAHYDSGWLPAANTIGANGAVMPLDIIVPAAIYDKIADTPVALHITLGAEQSAAESAGYNVTATTASFPVPHGGACHLTPNGDMICAYAIHTPSGLGVRADAAMSCAADAPAGGSRMPVTGVLMPSPNLPSIDVVSIGKVMFFAQGATAICPGSKVTVSEAGDGPRGSMHLDVAAVRLSSYAMRLGRRGPRARGTEPHAGAPDDGAAAPQAGTDAGADAAPPARQ